MRLPRPSSETVLVWVFVVVGTLWGAWLGGRHLAGLGSSLDRFENLTADLRFSLAGARSAPRGVVIAAIDDETVHAAGAYPLPRPLVAKIIRELAARGPQAIAIDILFVDPGAPGADAALARALESTHSVVAAMGTFGSDSAMGSANTRLGPDQFGLVPQPTSILWPMARVRGAARAGLANLATDASGVPRHIPLIFRSGEVIEESFALSTVAAALNAEPVLGPETVRLAGRAVRTDLGYHLPIRFYGPHGTIRQFSAARLLQGELDADEVRGQIVVLGASASGVTDTFANPFDTAVPGVEIYATAISNLLAGDSLVRTRAVRIADALVALLLPGIAVSLTAMRRTTLGIALACVVVGLWGTLVCALFAAGYWLSIAVPLAALVPVAIPYGLARLWLDRRIAARLAAHGAALGRFQSPRLVERLARDPDFLAIPVRQDVGVAFLDLSGFTGLAQSLGPEWTRDLLARFHVLIERDVEANEGLVIDYMGDGAMIVFGVPDRTPHDASHALGAAMQLRKTIAAWIGTLPQVARDRLKARIGAHFGPAVVSRLGASHHQHITATGDTVNVASRLLEVAKEQGGGVVISEDLAAAADSAALDAAGPSDAMLETSIRGRDGPARVRVWR